MERRIIMSEIISQEPRDIDSRLIDLWLYEHEPDFSIRLEGCIVELVYNHKHELVSANITKENEISEELVFNNRR
jgi:hypothetical protein